MRVGKAARHFKHIVDRCTLKGSRQQSFTQPRRFGPASVSWPAKHNPETEVLCDSGTSYGPPVAAGSEVRVQLHLGAAIGDGRGGWAGVQEEPRRLEQCRCRQVSGNLALESRAGDETSLPRRILKDQPVGEATMNSVRAPPVGSEKQAPMSSRIGDPVPSFSTGCK
jgi:hypothetical protein